MALPRASRISFGRARALRKRLTDAERKLWLALRRDALGVRFRRQHPIGPYIADFACYPLKLVVEIDGGTHGSDDEKKHDAQRDAYLRGEGWRVLRFTNEAIYGQLREVAEAIGRAIRDAQDEQDTAKPPM